MHALTHVGKGFKPNWSRSLRDQWLRAIHALRKQISHSPAGFSRGEAGVYHEGSLLLNLTLVSLRFLLLAGLRHGALLKRWTEGRGGYTSDL